MAWDHRLLGELLLTETLTPFMNITVIGKPKDFYKTDTVLNTSSTTFNVDDYTVIDGQIVSQVDAPVSFSVYISAIGSESEIDDRISPYEVDFPCTSRWIAGYGYSMGRWRSHGGDTDLLMLTRDYHDPERASTPPVFWNENDYAYRDHVRNEWIETPALVFDASASLYTDTEDHSTNDGMAVLMVAVIRPPSDTRSMAYLFGFVPFGTVTRTGLAVVLDSFGNISVIASDRAEKGYGDSPRVLCSVRLRGDVTEPTMIAFRLLSSPERVVQKNEEVHLFVRNSSVNLFASGNVRDWSSGSDMSIPQKLYSSELAVFYSDTEDRFALLEVSCWLHDDYEEASYYEAMSEVTSCYGLNRNG